MADLVTYLPEPAAAGEIRAAGAVLWRRAGPGIELALIHRDRYDDWTFPKGKGLPGEHVLLTAVREVAEETGVRAVLGRRLRTSRYPDGGRVKRVDWWAATPAPEPPVPDPGFVPNDEVDDLRWLPLAAAREMLSYPRDVALLDEFAAGPAQTVPVILIRHAHAESREAWRAAGETDDLARPLTARGEAQAQELAAILSCYGALRVVSSATERCLATMRPYTALTGAAPEGEAAFTVQAPAAGTGTDTARQRLLKLVSEGGPVAVCAHRENLPALLAGVCEHFGVPVPAGQPLPKGGFWVLQAAAGALLSVEQHHPGG